MRSELEKLSEMNDSPVNADNNGGVPERSSFSSLSTQIISESPIKKNFTSAATSTIMVDIGFTQVKSRSSFTSSKRSFGSSKDETFFDSHNQWLQYESEDDFYSVNGEFTPSVGNTPKCSFSSSEKHPRFHNPLFEEEKLRVSFSKSPTPRRKKLAELFRESVREERVHVNLEDLCENQSEDSKRLSCDDDSYGEIKVSEDSAEEKKKKKKNLKSLNDHHRCLPKLSSFKGSLMEKRKKKKKKKFI